MLSPCRSRRSGRSPSTAGPSAATASWRWSARCSTRAAAPCRRSALVEDVWEGIPPDDAAGAVQALVSRARRLGLPSTAAPGGYRLPTDGCRSTSTTPRRSLDRGPRRAARRATPRRARDLGREARALAPRGPGPGRPGDRAPARRRRRPLRAEAGLALGRRRRTSSTTCAAAPCAPRPTSRSSPCWCACSPRRAATPRRSRWSSGCATELADRYGTDPSPVVAQAHLALLRGELAGPRRRAAGRRRGPCPARAWRRPATALVGRDDGRRAGRGRARGGARWSPSSRPAVRARRGWPARSPAARSRPGRPVRVVELAGLRAPAEVLPTVLAAIGGSDATAARADLPTERRLLTPEDRLRLAAQDLDGLAGARQLRARARRRRGRRRRPAGRRLRPTSWCWRRAARRSASSARPCTACARSPTPTPWRCWSRGRAPAGRPSAGTRSGRSSCATGWTTCRSRSSSPPPGCGR